LHSHNRSVPVKKNLFFHRKRGGRKIFFQSFFFVLSTHLQNVLVTVSDKKTQVSTNGTTVDYYTADIITANDYYPFGMMMPERKYTATSSSKYRFSINGQEKETELNPNITTAMFWEYDSRIGRRWNVDPIYKHSPYECFSGNPISFVDRNGLDTFDIKHTRRTETSGGSNDGHSDNLRTPERKSVTNSFNITVAKGGDKDVFRYTFNTENVDANGNVTTTSGAPQIMKMGGIGNPSTTMFIGKALIFDGIATKQRYLDDEECIGKLMSMDPVFKETMIAYNPSYNFWMTSYQAMNAGEKLIPVVSSSAAASYFGALGSVRGLGTLSGYGSDGAIVDNAANLVSKRGWYDVVVHGTDDGLGFTMNGNPLSVEQLYSNMLANGYQQGTRIRLMSCYSGSLQNGAAFQLSKLANAPVVAPSNTMWIANGQGFLPRGKLMVDNGGWFNFFQ
jgi:RHS repeat-associated protein